MTKTEFKIEVDIRTNLEKKGISKNELCRMTNLQYHALQRYYNNQLQRVDLNIIARLCQALDCEVSDILKKVEIDT